MDLLLIFRKIWRHKLVTAPVIALTICGMAYVVAVRSPTYMASASYILINPPPAPTADEIDRDPALGKINSDNPYTRFSDPSVIIDVLTRTLASTSARQELMRAGASSPYTVASAAHFGATSPIVQITGKAPSPQEAIRTATVVSHAVVGELDRMQQAQHVDPRYRITAHEVEGPDGAQLQASGQLRSLVGVIALGAILLFVVVSLMDALDTLRVERAKRAATLDVRWTHDESWPAEDDPAEGLSGLDAESWLEFEEDAPVDDLSTDRDRDPASRSKLMTNGNIASGSLQSQHERQKSDR